MQLITKSKNYTLSKETKAHLTKKIGKLRKYFNRIVEIEVEVTQEKDTLKSKKIEVILRVVGKTIRAKEVAEDIFLATDKVVEKLEKQIKKYKEKLKHLDKSRTKSAKKLFPKDIIIEEENPSPQIVKTKQFAMKPMDAEEASEQMELLGHSFFVFLNSKTEKVNVIYKRRDGNFGLIEPEF